MIPLVNAYSPQYLERVKSSRIRRLTHNAKVHLQNFIQDTGRMRKESYIFATALMIALSCMIAYSSAIKAKGTSDEYHRSSEFSKTFFRRVVAFFITFNCLRYIEAAASYGLKRYFGVVIRQEPSTKLFKNVFKDLGKLFTGKELPLAQRYVYAGEAPYESLSRLDRFRNIENKWYTNFLAPDKNKTLNPVDRVKTLITRAAMIIGSIPTILVSGPLLERYNQSKIETYFANLMLPPGEYTATNGGNAATTAKGSPDRKPLNSIGSSDPRHNGFSPFMADVAWKRYLRQQEALQGRTPAGDFVYASPYANTPFAIR